MIKNKQYLLRRHLFLLVILLVILAGFSCAPIVTIEDEGPTGPSAAGPPLDVTVDSLDTDELGLVWSPPINLGTKDGGIVLIPDELSYRVYYLQANENEEKPLAEVIKNKALGINPPKMIVTSSGITRSQIINLKSGERYFLVVETFNPFASAETLSTEVIEVYTQVVLEGILTYPETEYELTAHEPQRTINPDSVPTTSSGEAISYSFDKIDFDKKDCDKIDGNLSDTVFAVDESSGEVTINPTTTGCARFIVRAEARGYLAQEVTFTITIGVRESGAVTDITIPDDSVEGHSFEVRWTEPVEKGTRQDGRILRSDELVYRVYYLAGNAGDLPPDNAGDLISDAKSEFEEVQGTMSARIIGLSAETRYFVTVETYNSYLDTGTASEEVVEGTTTATATGFSGSLTYADDEYSYPASLAEATITPSTRPTNLNLQYGMYRRSGVPHSSDTSDFVLIDSDGVITVKPKIAQQAGAANYLVYVRATGFNTQYVAITIRIIQFDISVIPYYDDEEKTDLPVPLGQAIWDASLADNESVLLLVSSEFEGDYMIQVDDGEGNYERGIEMTARGHSIYIQKSDFTNYEQFRNNGVVLGISGHGIAGIKDLAISRPHEIRNWQDLQSMRVNLDGDYVLMNNIELPHAVGGTSNFEQIGIVSSSPFKGSLDGTNGTNGTERFRINGLRIESTDISIGLFGFINVRDNQTIAVKNLILENSTLIGKNGNAWMGTLVGHISKGIVRNVGVVSSSPNRGRVEWNGEGEEIERGTFHQGVGVGGLVGFNRGRVEDCYSTVQVSGASEVGGLVGNNNYSGFVSGYATGDVTGTYRKIGGLVGSSWDHPIRADHANVIGYATGDVTGQTRVGGLVGWFWSYSGKVIGYATGNVGGGDKIGGLIGEIHSDAVIHGYSTGTVRGANDVGGLIGFNTNGYISGYSRSPVYRATGSEKRFGRIVGAVSTNISQEASASLETQTYSSIGNPPESKLYNNDETNISGPEGKHGISIDINNVSSSSAFSGLSFGTDIGQWIWVESGKWPAINIGDIAPADEQVLD